MDAASEIGDVVENRKRWCVAQGDVRSVLAGIPDGVFHTCVTSPPYWSLRSYLPADHPEKEKEIGSEETIEEYIQTLVVVFRDVRRVLRDDGICWLNLGDSYNHGTCSEHKLASPQVGYWNKRAIRKRVNQPALKPLDMFGLPWLLALALRADGWYLRGDVIWDKASPTPERVNSWRWERCRVKVKSGSRGRQKAAAARVQSGNNAFPDHSHGVFLGKAEYELCPGCKKCGPNNGYVLRKGAWRPTRGHELIFQFTKSPEYFADAQAIAEKVTGNAHPRGDGIAPRCGERGKTVKQHAEFAQNVGELVTQRNPRTVWRFSNEPATWDFCLGCGSLYQGADRNRVEKPKVDGHCVRICPNCGATDKWVDHFASFPTELPERCIRASTSEKGCCPDCGSQYARVIEKTRVATRPADTNVIDESGKANRDPERHVTETRTLGWRPTCNCQASRSIEPLVLDAFCGSGRTVIAARRLNCRAVGIELNPAYVTLSETLIRADAPLLNS